MPFVFWTVFGTGIFAVLGAIYFAWHNPSQGLVLSVAAFVGAFFLLCVHSALELKSESTFDRAIAEYTLDRLLPELASAFYATDLPGSLRGSIEKEISALVARQNPNAFKKEPEELAQDMAITSFLDMLFLYQPDWQLRPIKFGARYTFSMETFEPLSQPEDCTKVSVEDINSQLKLAENVFAEIPSKPIYMKEICLPPKTRVRIERRAVAIETDYCDITVAVKKTGGQMFVRPQLIRPGGSRSITPEDLPDGPETLQDGSARYTSMPIPIEVHVRYKWLYAKHRDLEKIKAWVGRLSAGTHTWFEGSGQDFMRLPSPLETSPRPTINPSKDHLPATQNPNRSASDNPHG